MEGSDTVSWHFFSASFNVRPVKGRNSHSCSSEAYAAVGQLEWDMIMVFLAKTEFLVQRSLQNLGKSVINGQDCCHLFTCVEFICFLCMIYFPY